MEALARGFYERPVFEFCDTFSYIFVFRTRVMDGSRGGMGKRTRLEGRLKS